MVAVQIKDFGGSWQIDLPETILEETLQTPLGNALMLTSVGHYPIARYHFIERDEPIPDYILIHCVAGSGWFKQDGVYRKINANQCCCLEAGKAHAYGADEANPWSIYWVRFRGTLAPEYANLINTVVNLPLQLISRIFGRINLFEEMYQTLMSGYTTESVLYASTCLHHYLGSLAFLRQYSHVSDALEEKFDIVDSVIRFLQENIEKHYSVEDLSAVAGYSPTRFSAIFKKKTGHAPIAYFNQMKIRYACKLIETTDMKMNQLCYKVGIPDSFYFSRLFSKIMGMSPKDYRRNVRTIDKDMLS